MSIDSCACGQAVDTDFDDQFYDHNKQCGYCREKNMSKDNSGQAFPYGDHTNGGDIGMSLRDWYAGMAMQGDFASQSEATGEWASSTPDDFLLQRAKFYYRVADAMLKARES